ncbi:MAG: HupE/UreJ family protein [Alphaproteobacteria bacterium]|nr:HupE/UreJ family protein [Alphaproteobacteria bacterium]
MSGTLVAASVSVLVLGLCWRRRLNAGAAIALFSLAGLLHGYAYGESIVGAEPAPLVAYLLGLACIQYAVALGAWWTAGRLVQPATRQDVLFRGACASFIFVPGVGFSVMSLLG